jgi:hypothetical protein
MLNLVCLLDLDADTDTVDTRLDQDSLILIPGYRKRVEEDLRRAGRLDLRYVMSF